MKPPRWIQNRRATRARLERQIADADGRATSAASAARELREQLVTVTQQRNDARALAEAAQQVATEHGRTIGRVRQVLAEFDGTTSPTAVALAASVRRALDGEVETHE